MNTVFKTLLNKDGKDVVSYIEYFLDVERKSLVSAQEEEVFLFLKECIDNSGATPSENYFIGKFEQYKIPLSSSKSIDLGDLRIHCQNLIHKRANQNASKELMKIATEVSNTGLTYEHMDSIRGYLTLSNDDAPDTNPVETADNFRSYYANKKTQPIGLQTFIKEIDSKIGGVAPGMTAVLGGYVGSFKSTLGCNIAYNNTKKLNYNLCLISLEVPKEEVLTNLLSRHSYESKFNKYPFIGHSKIRKCELTSEEEDYVMNDVLNDYMTEGGKLIILDETDFKTFSMGEIREKLEQIDDDLVKETGYGLDGVVWDHAHLFKYNGVTKKRSSEGSEINEYISFIRKLSINFRKGKDGTHKKLAMIVLAQINREGWKKAVKTGGRYDLRALAEANELERAAQIVMTIFTDENMKMAKEASVQLLKNRNGVTNLEPISIFVDAECYVAGEEMEGFSTMLNMDDISSVFDSGQSIVDIL